MARFVLHPCRFREDRFIPLRDASLLELDWVGLVDRLAPTRSPAALMNLKRLRVNSFVGLVRNPQTGEVGNFYLLNPDRSGSLTWLLHQDQSFPERLLESFKVVSANWDYKFEELPGFVAG